MEKSKAKEKVKYVDTLDKEPRDRYLDKIRHLKGTDPYEVRSWSTDPEILPPLSYPDIVTYLVLDQSAYTTQEFKRFKSLEAHVKFTNGWVQDIKSYTPNGCDNTVIHAKVLHSHRLSEKPLNPWVITHKDGTVVTAHCDCMAGLSETCSHVVALLFKLEAVVLARERTTVTGQPAYRMIPSAVSEVEPEVGYKIDFTTAAAKKKAVDRLISGEADSPQGLRTARLPRASTSSAPTEAETEKFLRDLHRTGDKAVLLSTKLEYCTDYC